MRFPCLISLCLMTLSCFPREREPTKHALLFAVGNYPESGGWPKLSSLSDLAHIEKALLDQGFLPEHIQKVSDEGVTIQGVSAAFDALIRDVGPGDIVVIHFSCHGEQVKADDANKPGGLDECVVTFNAISPYQSTDFNKDQAAYLRGHTLGSYIARLRSKLGTSGDVIVFLDFCHSGGGTRGRARIRGGQPPLVPKGWRASPASRPEGSSFLLRETMTPTTARGNDAGSLAAFSVFSATRPEELDMETVDDQGEGVGSLTYAICKTFENLVPGMTYRMLFARMQAIMNIKVPSQHPLLEGNGADRLIFGGSFIEQKPYFAIAALGKENRCTVKAGLLAGLDSGARIALYPAGTADPSGATALAAGIVTKADNYTSVVQLDKDPGIGRAVEGWAFITVPVYRIKPIPITIVTANQGAVSFTTQEAANIRAGLRDLPLVTFDGEPELLFIKGRVKDSLKIAGNGYLFGAIRNDSSLTRGLGNMIRRYAQYKFLQQLDLHDKEVRAEVRLILRVNGHPDTSAIRERTVGGVCTFRNGDSLVVWVKNTGRQAVYVNILDLQPDGVINPILPNREENIFPYNLKVEPGGEQLFSHYIIAISPPYGTEVFKVFASSQEIDMEDVAKAHGVDRADSRPPTKLEDLVKKSFNLTSRGGHSSQSGPGTGEGSTYNLLFNIEPAK